MRCSCRNGCYDRTGDKHIWLTGPGRSRTREAQAYLAPWAEQAARLLFTACEERYIARLPCLARCGVPSREPKGTLGSVLCACACLGPLSSPL